MSGGFSTSAIYCGFVSKPQTGPYWVPTWSSSVFSPGLSRDLPPLCSSDVTTLNTRRFAAKVFTKINLRCNCSSNRPGGGSNPGENDSKIVLDAFFLGKALGEALTERIESAGEFLSALGRLQAEQQKQAHNLQEEIMERAKRAKERAARESHGSSRT